MSIGPAKTTKAETELRLTALRSEMKALNDANFELQSGRWISRRYRSQRHTGIKHAAVSLSTKMTGANTNPYHLHQILIYLPRYSIRDTGCCNQMKADRANSPTNRTVTLRGALKVRKFFGAAIGHTSLPDRLVPKMVNSY